MIPEAIARALDRRVSVDELRQELQRAIDPAEREEVIALVRWFTRRYPSTTDRLAYVRKAYARWREAGAGADRSG